MTRTIRPTDHIKSDQQFEAYANQNEHGWRMAGQLTREQYEALDGKKVKHADGTLTFKRWRKMTDTTDADGKPIQIEIDRVYVSNGRRIYGQFSNGSVGYIEASASSGMTPDASGNTGGIFCDELMRTTEEIARAMVQAVNG
jgi:hypothetical protein